MDLKHLRYFTEVVEQQSFTRAAEKLRLTQPMLSHTIKQMERELGVQLIERTSKHFRLTDTGAVFYREATELLLRFNDLYRNIDDIKSTAKGNVHFSIPGVLLDAYFPPLLMQFYQSYPGIDISIVEEGSKLTAHSVLAGDVDLGMVMLPVANQHQFNVHIVLDSVCQVLVSKQHALARRGRLHIKDLAGEQIITFSETATLHDTFIAACEKQGFTPRIAYKSLMINFILEMVRQGPFVAVLPLPLIDRNLSDDLVTLPLVPAIPWKIATITTKGLYQPYAAQAMLAFVRAYFAGGTPGEVPRL